MDALQLLTWSLILYLFASLASLFLLGLDRLAIKLSGITSLVGGVIGIISGITQLHAGVTLAARFATPFEFADLTLRMDSLSAFMVLVISLLVVVCSLYSLTYMREYEGKGAAAMGFFMNLFIASMVALLVMDNAFWFIVLFEMMSLSSWFLVIARQDKTSINAGMLYFFIAHGGSVLIMIAFLLMGRESGSLDFASFRTLSLSPGLASAVFLLAFFGFGAKAGMMPLHSWLPRAHPAAPSHASALMSGVMVKIGIFGILNIRENTVISSLKRHKKGFYLSEKSMKEDTQKYIDALRTKTPSQETKIRALSGGNQQKVILGRWLLTDPEVLLLDEPTRGIDVGAKYEIYQLIIDLANRGKVVIVVSSEMPELLGICDRIMVMSGGRLAGEINAEEATQELIMTYAAKYV